MSFITSLKEQLSVKSNPEYAIKMKAYMKGHFDYLGIQSEPRRKIVNEILKENQQLLHIIFSSLKRVVLKNLMFKCICSFSLKEKY